MSENYSVNYSDEALDDLRGIYEYIAYNLQSPDNAKGQVDRIRAEVRELGKYPKRYAPVGKEPWKSLKLRRMNVGNYAVLFYADDEHMRVDIARIVFAARDLDKFLEENLT